MNRAPVAPVFPNGGQALLLVLALFVLEIVFGALLRDAQDTLGLDDNQRDALVVLLANGVLLTALTTWLNLPYRTLFHPARHSVAGAAALLGLPVMLTVPALVLLLSHLSDLLVEIFPMSRWEDDFFRRMATPGVGSFVMTCLLAPVLEELLFRGVILRGFLHHYPRWQAIGLSAVLFGAAHLNLYQFAVALLLGVFSGWLYERARSLVPCIVLHAAYNTALWALDATIDTATDANTSLPDWADSAAAWLVAGIAAVAGLRLLRRLLAPPA